jgi:hypothetical protein
MCATMPCQTVFFVQNLLLWTISSIFKNGQNSVMNNYQFGTNLFSVPLPLPFSIWTILKLIPDIISFHPKIFQSVPLKDKTFFFFFVVAGIKPGPWAC